jgi:hypothetical protein
VEFEPTIPAFERAKTVHALDLATTVIGQTLVSGLKRKAILVTGRGGPYGCDKSRLPHFLDIRLTDSGEVASLTLRHGFTSRMIPGTHFC